MRYGASTLPVPHGPTCQCDNCAGKRVANTERLTSTDRLAWLENQVIDLRNQITRIQKGHNTMGYALWCQPGQHPFDENEAGSRRMTTDRLGGDGQPTGGAEITIHVCARHAGSLYGPKSRRLSLKEIKAQIDEADELDD